MGYRSDVAIAVSIPKSLSSNEQIMSLIKSEDSTNFELVKQLVTNFELTSNEDKQLELIEYLLFTYDAVDDMEISDTYIKILTESFKWYDDYEDVSFIMNIIDELKYEDFGFIRIGEDYDDVETKGAYWEYEMYVHRSICFNC